MLENYLTKIYLSQATIRTLQTQFQKNKPFPHLILKNFFQPAFIHDVFLALQKERFQHQEADLYDFYQTNDIARTSHPQLISFHDLLRSSEFKHYVEALTNIPVPGIIDCSGFYYTSTHYLLPHDDRLDSRRIAYTLHLAKKFTRKDGGALQFFAENKIKKTIIPTFNTLVLFGVVPSVTFHQVSEVTTTKKRYSLAGWFHA